MKNVLIFVFLTIFPFVLPAAQTTQDAQIVTAHPGTKPPLPDHILYRHFFAWVNTLRDQAKTTHPNDPYAFARPFVDRTTLTNADLDVLVDELSSSSTDLHNHDAKAQSIIEAYRAKARDAARGGKPLPPPPPELPSLVAGRTAILIHHTVMLKKRLGPDAAASLDRYLRNEFAPHVSLQNAANLASGPARLSVNASFSNQLKR